MNVLNIIAFLMNTTPYLDVADIYLVKALQANFNSIKTTVSNFLMKIIPYILHVKLLILLRCDWCV